MYKLRRLLALIGYLAALNFALFFFSILLLGGDSLWGKIEDGHYYLGNHGDYVEVFYLVYVYSWLHAASAILSFPLILLYGAIYMARPGGGRVVVELGPIYQFVEVLCWRLFDAWRKPDVEFFALLTKEECVQRLESTIRPFRAGWTTSPPWFYVGKTQFDVTDNSRSLVVLHGQFTSTPQGTYVRAWHRFSVVGTLFYGVFGTVAAGLLWSISVVVLRMSDAIPYNPFGQFGILSVGFILGGLALSVWLGVRIGRRKHADWAEHLKEILTRKQILNDQIVIPNRSHHLISRR